MMEPEKQPEVFKVYETACGRCLFGPNPICPLSVVEAFRAAAGPRDASEELPLTCHRAAARREQVACACWWAKHGDDYLAQLPGAVVERVPQPPHDEETDCGELTDPEKGCGRTADGRHIDLEHLTLTTKDRRITWRPGRGVIEEVLR